MVPSPAEDLLENKRALRREMGKERAALSAAERSARSAAACARLLGAPPLAGIAGRTVAGYVALDAKGELDPAPALQAIATGGGRVAYPRVNEPLAPLTFHLADRAALVTGRFGLREPPAGAPEVPVAGLDLVVVPGMAFDAAGRRVGFGGGFYDRTFSGRAGGPPLIGICFDFQVVARCPTGAQDVGVDWLVTEARVLRCEPPR